MKEFPAVYPLLDGIIADGPLPKTDGSCSFSAIHEESGKELTVVRISIPESLTNANALFLAGVIDDPQNADQYFRDEVEKYKTELSVFASLSKNEHICGYLRYQVVPKEDTAGYDIYILSKRRTSLSEYLKNNNLTFEQGISLGLDLCNAASEFRSEGYIHQHIATSTVFEDDNHFSVGGLGICSLDTLADQRKKQKDIGLFTAPESCALSARINDTADIYSIGMILYYVFNGNHYPFEEAESSYRLANQRRISGEDLPSPLYADYELDSIIRKACAFNPEDRYQSAAEFKIALEDYRSGLPEDSAFIIPPLVFDGANADAGDVEDTENDREDHDISADYLTDDFKETFTPREDAYLAKSGKKHIWPYILLVLLVLFAGLFAYYRFYYSAVTISDIEVVERGIDYLTVAVNSNNNDALAIRCTADDCSYSEIFRCSDTQTFAHLDPNKVYSFEIYAIDNNYVKGINTLSSATLGATVISDFSMKIEDSGAASLFMQVSGPEPDVWELRSYCGDRFVNSYTVQNHTCLTDVLLPNTGYTFILNPGPGYSVSGATSAEAIRNVEITGLNLNVSYDSEGKTISANWEADLDLPSSWIVSCTGSNGYHQTDTVSELHYTFTDIIGNSEYTVNITNASGSSPLLSTITVPAGTVSELSAVETDDGLLISWYYDGNYEINGWKISLINEDLDAQQDYESAVSELIIKDYLPGTNYKVLLDTQYVTMLSGELESTVETADAELFADNTEHKLGATYAALYERPKEDWTLGNLNTSRSSFASGSPFVFLIQAVNIPEETDEVEPIMVLMTIRDENNKLVYADSYESNWNDVWDINLFAHEMKAPLDLGEYTAQVYFNRYLVCTSPLTVK